MAQMTRAFPEKSFSGIGGISDFSQALNYFLLGCGTVQVCTAAMLDHAVGPNVIKRSWRAWASSWRRTRIRGWRRSRISAACAATASCRHSQIRRPEDSDYQGGHEAQEGYAEPRATRDAGSAATCRPPLLFPLSATPPTPSWLLPLSPPPF